MNAPVTEEAGETGQDVRRLARDGFTGLTVGRARGYQQANVAIVPAEVSEELIAFCRANPVPCPLLDHSEPGSPYLRRLGEDVDVRRDLPRFEVHSADGSRIVTDITPYWKPDSVAIAVGCWFGAERALADAGIRMRHVELGLQGPLFRTNRPTTPSGRFHPNLVVSMRPFQDADVEAVAAITSTMRFSHGAPIHRGDPETLGIGATDSPDWGETLLPEAGETSLYWGCGLTLTEALLDAGVAEFITHAPGSMLVTDLPDREGH